MSDKTFSPTENGISHPLTRCSVWCTDDGRVVIMAGDKAGIILDEETGVVTIFGTDVRFVTEEVKVNGKRLKESMLDQRVAMTGVGKQIRRIDKLKE